MVTIEDIARIAKVSTATVSRVLNGTAKVSKETAERVMQVVEEYNYETNFMGRGLRVKHTKMILVTLNSIVNNFYAKVVKGVEDAAHENGYNIIMGTNYDIQEREKVYLDLLKRRMVDGAILMRPSIGVKEIDDLSERFSVIQCCEYILGSKAPYISIDNYKAGYDMTKEIIKKGHRKIALLRGNDNMVSTIHRTKGYKDALAESNIPFDERLILIGNFGYKNAYKQMYNFLQTNEITALFALSDRMAAGASAAAKDLNKDISIAGFDNIDISYIVSPALTTVSQNQYKMGYLAASKLISAIRDKAEIKSEFVEHSIIWRESIKNKEC